MRPQKAYRDVINDIEQRVTLTLPLRPTVFAAWEVREKTGYRTDTIIPILDNLAQLGYVTKTDRAFAHRHWKVLATWVRKGVQQVIEDYETLQLVTGRG